MNQLFNFHDTLSVAIGNWWLILLALALGIWVGWVKSKWVPSSHEGAQQ